jgi:hypothetical protein
MQNHWSAKCSGRNEALKIAGTQLKSWKCKMFRKERSSENTGGSFEITKA